MMGKTFHIGGNTYKGTIYRWVLLLVTTLVLVFGLYTFYNYRRESLENTQTKADNTVNRIVSQIDERLRNLMQYYVNIVSEDSIQWMLNNTVKYSNYSRYKAAYDDMGAKGIFRDYISGFALVNFKTGWVLSNKGLFQMEDTGDYEMIDLLYENDSHRKNYWNYQESDTAKDGLAEKTSSVMLDIDGLSYVMRLPATSYNTHALLIANLNMDSWHKWIQEWMDSYEEVIVLDAEGSLLYATDDNLAAECVSLYAEGSLQDNGSLGRIQGNGSTYMVSEKASDVLNWRYFVLHNVEDAQVRAGVMFVLMMCLLLFGAFSFLTVSYFIYRPIDVLVKNFSKSDGNEPIDVYGGNELDYLEGSLRNMKEDKQALESVIDQQQEKISELFELRLMRGEVDDEEWEEYLKGLRLRPWKYFATVVVILSIRSEEVGDMMNEDAICLGMLQEMPGELKTLAWMPPIYNAGTIFAMFAEEDESLLFDAIKKFCEGMQECAWNMGSYHVMMGVSATHTHYNHTRIAYRESINALTFKPKLYEHVDGSRVWEMEDCHFYLANSASQIKLYNRGYEDAIKAAVKAVDKQQCYRVTDDFYLYLGELEGRENELCIYLLRFVNTIMLTAVDTGVDITKVYPDGIRKIYEEFLEVLEPERERRFIKWKFIDPVIRERTEDLEDHSEAMLEEIERMIAEKNGSISLSECADALGVHSTYIWKLLKMERNKSFSDYVEEYKLSEAKRLLLETDFTVAEIAEKLGYTNAQNFIRFFSKSTGVTPGKFRKLY